MMYPRMAGESDRQTESERDRDRGTEKERQREMSEREVRVRHTQRKKENGKRLKKITIVVSINLTNGLLYKLKSKNSNY